MTRTIKASEVKPGMTIRWDSGGITYQCKVGGLFPSITSGLVSVEAAGGGYIPLSRTQPVTVLSEPAPPQPEEPTEFGARVVVDGRRFLRADGDSLPWVELDVRDWHNWDGLCQLGTVMVIPDQGWAVPADTPEVPERIEEWPEDDTALRKHKWRDRDGDIWSWAEAKAKWKCHDHMGVYRTADHWPSSLYAPFTRVTDA